MEMREIEDTIEIEVIISNTKGTPVMEIDTTETIDVIINKTKGTPVTGIETTEIMVITIKVKITCHRKHTSEWQKVVKVLQSKSERPIHYFMIKIYSGVIFFFFEL